jgi:hypothetical protein
VENKASAQNLVDFKPGQWIELEDFAVVTGPIVDLKVKVDDEKDKPLLDMIEV